MSTLVVLSKTAHTDSNIHPAAPPIACASQSNGAVTRLAAASPALSHTVEITGTSHTSAKRSDARSTEGTSSMVDVCDVPVISTVCDKAGDAAASLVTAPFDWLAQAMGGAAGWMFESVWAVFDSTTRVDITSPQYTRVY